MVYTTMLKKWMHRANSPTIGDNFLLLLHTLSS